MITTTWKERGELVTVPGYSGVDTAVLDGEFTAKDLRDIADMIERGEEH